MSLFGVNLEIGDATVMYLGLDLQLLRPYYSGADTGGVHWVHVHPPLSLEKK